MEAIRIDQRQRRLARWMALVAALSIGACGGSGDSTQNGTGSTPAPAPTPAPTGIGPAGGTVSGPYGSQVSVPAGALSTTVDIALAMDSTGMPAMQPDGIDTAGAPFALTPHGTAFATASTVRVPYDATRIPTDADPVLYKAEPGGAFAPITTTIDNGFLVADVSNFSWVVPGYASTAPRAVYTLTADSTVSSFPITRNTGALPAAAASAPTGEGATSVVVHPSRRFLYVLNAGNATINGVAPNSITTYGLDPVTGAVGKPIDTRAASSASPPAPPVLAAVHPTGRFVYVVNRDPFSSNPNKQLSLFAVNATTGVLDGPLATGDATTGAPPTGIAFDPSGEFAYVTYEFSIWAPVGDPFVGTVKTYEVNRTTGALVGPIGSAPAGDHPFSIVVEPAGNWAYVADISGDVVRRYAINQSAGMLTPTGTSTQVVSAPASLAVDPLGRFLYVAKQQPTFNMNLLAYTINTRTGDLSFASGVLLGAGAQVGPIAVAAEPQGQFVYANNGALVAYKVDGNGNLTQEPTPTTPVGVGSGFGGIGSPWAFAASGTHPVWQNRCSVLSYWNTGLWGVPPGTFRCALTTTKSASSNAAGNTTPPPPPSSFSLYVNITGDAAGAIVSSPAGIDYNQVSAANQDHVVAGFPAGSGVTLTGTVAPNQPAVTLRWSGSGCTAAGSTVSVTMTSDKFCTLTFKAVSP